MTTKISRSNRCPTCGRKPKRSTASNRRYWLVLHMIADKVKPGGVSYSAEAWHLYFKSRFIGADDVTLPNLKVIVVPRSSADMSTDEFHDYATQVEAWAAERDVYLDEIPQ